MIVPSTGGLMGLHCCKQDITGVPFGLVPSSAPGLVLNRGEVNQSVRPRIVTPNTRMGWA